MTRVIRIDCDRCTAEIPEQSERSRPGATKVVLGFGTDSARSIDLCHICAEDFADWLTTATPRVHV